MTWLDERALLFWEHNSFLICQVDRHQRETHESSRRKHIAKNWQLWCFWLPFLVENIRKFRILNGLYLFGVEAYLLALLREISVRLVFRSAATLIFQINLPVITYSFSRHTVMLGMKFRNHYEKALTSPDPLKKEKLQTNSSSVFYSQGVDGMEVIHARFDFFDRDGINVTVKKRGITVQWFCFFFVVASKELTIVIFLYLFPPRTNFALNWRKSKTDSLLR